MKKVSVLSSLLAIMLAVGSAFTTRPTFTQKWEIFGVTNDAVSGSSPTTSAAYSNKIADGFNRVSTSAMTSASSEVSAYNAEHPFGPTIVCLSDNDSICVIIVSYYDTPDFDLVIIDFILGDYLFTI